MKKIICFLTMILLGNHAWSQKSKTGSDSTVLWQTYKIAIEFNDLLVAKNSLFQISAAYPNDKSVYDSLATIYFIMGAYPQAVHAAEKAHETVALNEIRAYSYRNMGDLKTALALFESLYGLNQSPENGYQVASIQYSLKRFGECEAILEKILKHPDSADKKVVIAMDQGTNQEISYLAASENLKGALMLEMGKTEIARGCFERALAAEPAFILAKNNLDKLAETGEKP